MPSLNCKPRPREWLGSVLSERAIIMDLDNQHTDIQKKSKATKTIEAIDTLTVEIPTIKKDVWDQFDLFINKGQTKIIVLGPDEFPKEKAVFIFRLDLEQLSPVGRLMRRNGFLKTLYIIRPKSW